MELLSSKVIAGISRRMSDYVKHHSPALHRQLKTSTILRRGYSRTIPQQSGPDISVLLHAMRSAHLRQMPRIEGTLLSAGCAGAWYFDWVKERTGHEGRHIGIEYYMPKPSGLPANVEWIENTVGNMSAVGDASCEMVFSGQNLEHLWPEDVGGFFCESNRVLEDGGWLVVDSPNRLMTARLNWSHPEHTIEFTPAEAANLAKLAGFDVVGMVGLWTCRDALTGRMLPFIPDPTDEKWSLVERVTAAQADPENSFIWWMTARKSGPAQPAKLQAEIDTIFEAAWPERKERFVSGIGRKSTADGRTEIVAEKGEGGPMIYGPYMPLKKGHHYAEFRLRAVDAADPRAPVAVCDVVGSAGQVITSKTLTPAELQDSRGTVRLEFELDALEFGMQARCIALGSARVACEMPIAIS